RMFVLVVIGGGLNIFMSMILTRRSINIANKLNENLRSLTTADILSTDFLSSDLSDEFSFAIFMQNQVNNKLHDFASNADLISKEVINNTDTLVDAIEQASSTAIEQSAGTKECYSTMEEESSNLKNIFQNIKNVAATAQKTSEYVEDGMRILNETLQNMHDIEKSNQNTSSEIYILVSKISDMKNIISDIDSLVDKTRGIAFNAGLKASRSESSGRNFNIVANEVRRLANTISSATKGINKIIAEVLQSADNLTMTSEGGSEKIAEGKECLKKVQENFNEVRISSEITADSASNIENITLQMSTSFDQISSTIEQLSIGIRDLSTNVDSIQSVTQELAIYSNELKSKVKEDDNCNNINELKLVEGE
nr:methyl-accepting chemotaxis protein [Treponema sp.]